jgi:hypothetical protein
LNKFVRFDETASWHNDFKNEKKKFCFVLKISDFKNERIEMESCKNAKTAVISGGRTAVRWTWPRQSQSSSNFCSNRRNLIGGLSLTGATAITLSSFFLSVQIS